PAAAGRPADLRALGRRDRHPPGPRLAGGARTQAGDHLALLQPPAPRHPRGGLHRRAVRIQGGAAGRRRTSAAPGRGPRVVLRHRTAGARRARRAADPRGAGGLGGRSRQPGRHPLHRPGRPARHGPAGARPRRRAAAGDRAAPRRRTAARPCPAAAAVRRGRRRQHAVPPAAVHGAAPLDRGAGGQRARPAGRHARQHGREPAAHLRRTGARRGAAAPPEEPGRLPGRAGPDQRFAGPAAPRGARRRPRRRTPDPGPRRPRRDPAAFPPPAGLGVPRLPVPLPPHDRNPPPMSTGTGRPGPTPAIVTPAAVPAAATPSAVLPARAPDPGPPTGPPAHRPPRRMRTGTARPAPTPAFVTPAAVPAAASPSSVLPARAPDPGPPTGAPAPRPARHAWHARLRRLAAEHGPVLATYGALKLAGF